MSNESFKMDWFKAATPEPEPIRTTHYLHPTKGWKKGDGTRPLRQGCVPKAFKYSDGVIESIPRDKRHKLKKLIRQRHHKERLERINAASTM